MVRGRYAIVKDTSNEDEIKSESDVLSNKRTKYALKFWLSRFCGALFIIIVLIVFIISQKGIPSSPPEQIDPEVSHFIEAENFVFKQDKKQSHKMIFLGEGLSMDELETSRKELFSSLPGLEGRFLTELLLDKPVYKPGETVRGSCFGLNAFDLSIQPPVTAANIEIKDPKGVVIETLFVNGDASGIWSIQWKVPQNIAGGEYTIRLYSQQHQNKKVVFSSAERTFEVRVSKISNAKLKKRIEFKKDGYGPGEVVTATLFVEGSSNNDDIQASFIVTIDSEIVFEKQSIDVSNGEATVTFILPRKIDKGEGVIVAKVSSGPLRESVSKTIPIILNFLDIGVFPEGGVLTENGKHRVYVEVLDASTGKPVAFDGGIFTDVNPSNKLSFVTAAHEGRGVSELFEVPAGASRVFFEVFAPVIAFGQIKEIPFRHRQEQIPIVSISTSAEGSVFRNSLTVSVFNSKGKVFRVGIFKRELEIASQKTSSSDEVTLEFDFQSNQKHFGVLRVTLFEDETNKPLCERLVFRQPLKELEIELGGVVVDDITQPLTDQVTFQMGESLSTAPADGVAISVRTWMRDVDETTGELIGERVPVSATVSLRVNDAATAATSDERLLQSRLPGAYLLESEVDRFENAGEFLPRNKWGWHVAKKTDEKKEEEISFTKKIDLLLGTQGWRRFAYHDVAGFLKTGSVPLNPKTFLPIGVKKFSSRLISPVSEYSIERVLGLPHFFSNNQIFAVPPIMMRANFQRQKNFAQPMMMDAAAAAPEQVMMKMNAPMNAEGGDVMEEMAEMPADFAEDENDGVVADAVVAGGGDGDDAGNVEEQDERQGMLIGEARAAPLMGKQMNNDLGRYRPPSTHTRVYAKPQRKFLKKEMEEGVKRNDFEETVYFHPSVVTECSSLVCEAKVAFGLNDASSASFSVHADGVSFQNGILGAAQMTIHSSAAFEVDFSLPSIVVAGDQPKIPITLSGNKESSSKLDLQFSSPHLKLKSSSNKFETNEKRLYVDIKTSDSVRGNLDVKASLSAISGNLKDSVERSTLIIPRGFPDSVFASGMIKQDPVQVEFHVPSDYIPVSLESSILAYTSPVGKLNKAIEALIREPCGCFEQTSSTTYPLVFVLQYLVSHSGSNPEIVSRAREMLQRGYQKLISFETKSGGFEWFGAEPGHEALTAYGLLQFDAMSKTGIDVDEGMMSRTKKWMESRKDGEGGFLRNSRALDSFGAAPESTTNAYITWALVRAGLLKSKQNDKEVNRLVSKALDESDPYIVALAALSLYDATSPTSDDLILAKKFATKLVNMQDEKDGSLRRGAVDTITRSRGDALEIEATALAVLVWLHDVKEFSAQTRFAIEFLASKCQDGRFSSTQATALSLMAIIEYDKLFSKPLPKGKISLMIDGKAYVTKNVGEGNTKKCKGDLIWSDCGSSCTPTCEEPSPMCDASCQAKCTCPPEQPILLSSGRCGSLEDCNNKKSSSSNDKKKCEGGAVWTDCGSACTRTCEKPEIAACTLQCVAKCECPRETPILTKEGKCVKECKVEDKEEEEGIMKFPITEHLSKLGSLKEPHKFSLRYTFDDDETATEFPTIPFSMSFKYHVLTPKRNGKSLPNLELKVKLDKNKNIVEGDVIQLTATLKNIAVNEKGENIPIPMVVAIIGIPGGFETRFEQLKEIREKNLVDFFETQPGQVIFYFRALKAEIEIQIPIQLSAAIPGSYVSPASRTYLFYNDEDKIWSEGFDVEILPLQN